MKKQLKQVEEFHRVIEEAVGCDPQLIPCNPQEDRKLAIDLRNIITSTQACGTKLSHLQQRACLAIEELAEWIEAHEHGDLVAAGDALADRLYVLLGDAVVTGLPLEKIFDEVHRSNMTKRQTDPKSGKAVKGGVFDKPKLDQILSTKQKDQANDQVPLVGIWWDNGRNVVAYPVPAGKPDPSIGLCDSDDSHNDYWPEASMKLGAYPVDEYFSIPRGRVMYEPKRETWIIYHGNRTDSSRLSVIAAEFGAERWESRLDEHYMMGKAADRYFNAD